MDSVKTPYLEDPFSIAPYLNSPTLTVFNNSVTLQQLEKKRYSKPPDNIPTRGTIQEFSQKSRFRMMTTLSRIHLQSYFQIFFFTLTYHNLFPTEKIELKKQLNKFFIYLKRKNPDLHYIWRLELQKRGAPHFHLFLFNENFFNKIDEKFLKQQIKDIWFNCINDKNEYLELYSVIGYEIIEVERVFKYISKYIGKIINDPAEHNLGRRWSYSKNLIFGEIKMINLTNDLANIFRDNLILYLKQKDKGSEKFEKYILDSPTVNFLIPTKEFYIIFEKSIEDYRKMFTSFDLNEERIKLTIDNENKKIDVSMISV